MLLEPSHGHDYVVKITMEANVNEEGFVADFRAVKRLFLRLIVKELDKKNLDLLFEYPTAEVLSKWIWERLQLFLPLKSIEVREKPHSSVVYSG